MAGEMNIKPNAYQKLVHRFLMLKIVSALLAKILHRADTFMLRITGGQHTFAELVGLPITQLTMVGARTGKARTLPLVSIPHHNKIVLIATNFGQRHNPGWYYNLKVHPECDVLFDGRSGKYIARETDGEEYACYWQMAVSYYMGYEKYKERAAPRHIPVMVLEPKKG
jgi:deazaflavin-dependent oxidoreductase (nitroreductase family)